MSIWSRHDSNHPPAHEAGSRTHVRPPKNGVARAVTLSPDTIEMLRQHKREQAALNMANRTTYKDLGLVFGKEYGDLTNRADMIGLPLEANSLGERQFS